MTMANSTDLPQIDTAYSYFLNYSEDSSAVPTALILRGVNLSSTSKYPAFSTPPPPANDRSGRDQHRQWQAGVRSHLGEEEVGLYSEAEQGGKDGWFVGHPIAEEGIEVHLRRLKAWGFRIIRLIVTWEALEHAGPGKYDEAYIDYLIRILRRIKAHGMRVFISPHQDVFSRFTGGCGAPYWALEAMGINPRRVSQTCSAVLHSRWDKEGCGGLEGRDLSAKGELPEYPDMIWNTNLHRLASRHCFTMFFASHIFAPKCKIDGQSVDAWLKGKYIGAYGRLADRLAEAGDLYDSCVIGWDSMNEPHEGFVGIPDLNEIPPSQEFRKGASPSPIQGFKLAVGQSVSDIAYDDFTSLGHKKLGKITITPPDETSLWLTRVEAVEAQKRWGFAWNVEWDFWDENGDKGCLWAGHGVWDKVTGEVLRKDYFHRDEGGTTEFDYMEQFWQPQYESYIKRIRQSHKEAISFINPPVFGSPPDLSEEVKKGRLALSSHFYDGLTLLGKRRHKFNADAVGLQRGQVGMLDAIKIGTSSIKNGLVDQFQELKSDASKSGGVASDKSGRKEYPTLIGELGVPFDMKQTKLFGLAQGKADQKDYRQPAKSMDELLQGCDGPNALSYTLWDYEPTNTHKYGDGWNGEDLSLFSYDDLEGDDDLSAMDPPDLSSLIRLGARAIEGWCRPYPAETMGIIKDFSFEMDSATFELRIEVVSLESSRFWQAKRKELGKGNDDFVECEGSTLIYLPYVHYLRGINGNSGENKIIGRPAEEEWIVGRVPAEVEVEVVEISEGRLEIQGQWGRWYYPLKKAGDREIYLKLRR